MPDPFPVPADNDAVSSGDARHSRTEDRDRIARDLDATFVHQIFAVSLDLSAALTCIEDRRAAEKVLHAIGGLDQAVKDLRSTIYRMRNQG